jgi:hypothetical protein
MFKENTPPDKCVGRQLVHVHLFFDLVPIDKWIHCPPPALECVGGIFNPQSILIELYFNHSASFIQGSCLLCFRSAAAR